MARGRATGTKNRNYPPLSLERGMKVARAIEHDASGMKTSRLTLAELLSTTPTSRVFKITSKDYTTGAFQSHLAKFAESSRGPILKKTGSRRNYRWQFINPQLIPYVRLSGIRAGFLS